MYPLVYLLGNSKTFSLFPYNLYASYKAPFKLPNSLFHGPSECVALLRTYHDASCILTSAHKMCWSLKKKKKSYSDNHTQPNIIPPLLTPWNFPGLAGYPLPLPSHASLFRFGVFTECNVQSQNLNI